MRRGLAAQLLLISAHPMVPEHVVPALKRAGFAVRLIGSVPEAIRMLDQTGDADGSAEWRPELIIVDSFFNEATGSQALRLLEWAEETPRYRSVPALCIVDQPDREALFAWWKDHPQRNDCYVIKPYNEEEVVVFACRMLGRPEPRWRKLRLLWLIHWSDIEANWHSLLEWLSKFIPVAPTPEQKRWREFALAILAVIITAVLGTLFRR